jgi:hypothetical protein
MKKYDLAFEGKYAELTFIQINKKQYDRIAKSGLPDSDSETGVEFYEELESNTWFTELLVPGDDDGFCIRIGNKEVVDLKFSEVKNIRGISICPLEKLTHQRFGKYILVCIRLYNDSNWNLVIDKKFSLEEIDLYIHRYEIFGGAILETLSISFEDQNFDLCDSAGEDELTYLLFAENKDPIEVN